MSKALSLDRRVRVLGAVEAGASHREAGERFGVSPASVNRWRERKREEVNLAPRPWVVIDGPDGSKRTMMRFEMHLVRLGTLRGFIAPFVLDGPVNREAFKAYVEQVVCPELRPGDIVIMDNLSSHKGPRFHELIRSAGAELHHLPPYIPYFNPVENAFAKPKALLRKAAQRTVKGLWIAIGHMLPAFRPHECRNYFAAAGYDAD